MLSFTMCKVSSDFVEKGIHDFLKTCKTLVTSVMSIYISQKSNYLENNVRYERALNYNSSLL